jgi:hypothetical protein
MTMSSSPGFRARPWQAEFALGRPPGRFGTFDALESEGLVAAAMKRQRELKQQRKVALPRAIPDDPDYRKYVPIDYRLDARPIVLDLIDDLSRGVALEHAIEAAEGVVTISEIFQLVEALALFAGPLAAINTFLSLGAPYLEAAMHIAGTWSASGFSRGAVLGAERRPNGGPIPARQVRDYFGSQDVGRYEFKQGQAVGVATYRAGLVAGYGQGRLLSRNQRAIFWRDLGRRMGDPSFRGPQAQWTPLEWRGWYTEVAACFRRFHLVEHE